MNVPVIAGADCEADEEIRTRMTRVLETELDKLVVAFVAILSGGLLGGCSQRERLNPLDPENGTTGGMIG